ncbi:MAG: YceI family protein [Bacteroidia bacterium]|jgi:polyisoprenoid-binding protein YceI|nr:YceI family protein [Bacteroidia bacterium]
MKKLTFILALAATSAVALAGGPKKPQSEAFKVDGKASTFKWHAKKVTGEHFGTMNIAGGTVDVEKGLVVGGTVEVDMTSINVTDLQGEYKGKLEGHLKSEDFFAVANHNKASLTIKRVEAIKGSKTAENFTVVADLTIKGITKEVRFPAIIVVKGNTLTANADFMINRTLWDIRYGSKSFIEGIGDKAIDDEFNVKVRIVAAR